MAVGVLVGPGVKVGVGDGFGVGVGGTAVAVNVAVGEGGMTVAVAVAGGLGVCFCCSTTAVGDSESPGLLQAASRKIQAKRNWFRYFIRQISSREARSAQNH